MKKETRKQKTEREEQESEQKLLDNTIINPHGILPDTFFNREDYDYGDVLALNNLD